MRTLIIVLVFACGFVSGAVVEMHQTKAEIKAATPAPTSFHFIPPQP